MSDMAIAGRFADQSDIRVHTCQKQQQQHAELSDAIKHSPLRSPLREKGPLRFGPDQAEERWAQQNAGHQVADHRWLAKALHRLAEDARR
jgi:hypothetical protein